MIVAIPSYKRPQLIRDRSLSVLQTAGIENKDIHIFVSNAEEYADYKPLTKEGYNVVHDTDCKNLMEKHNAILDYFGKGDRIIVMEDDIKRLVAKKQESEKGRGVETFTDIIGLSRQAWTTADGVGAKLWGINPTNNGFYMSHTIDTGLKCVCGYMFGIEITKDPFLRCHTENKHDYERTILHFIKHGAVVRVNHVGQDSVSFSTKGGLQAQHTNEERCESEIKGNQYLLNRFPHLVRPHHRLNRHFNKPTELLLAFHVGKKGSTDLMALQRMIDKKIGFNG